MNLYPLLVSIMCLILMPAECTKATNEKLFRFGFGVYDNSNKPPKMYQTINDCREATKSGIYTLKINYYTIQVRCEADFLRGGWTIIQRRKEHNLKFYQPWKRYRNGFGDIDQEFWLGLKHIYEILNFGRSELVIIMRTGGGRSFYVQYNHFKIGSEDDAYTLKSLGKYTGEAGDSLSYHLNKPWTTYDRHNYGKQNCAKLFHGAWWYDQCYTSNLNGKFRSSISKKHRCFKCMLWTQDLKENPIVFTQMMIRLKK